MLILILSALLILFVILVKLDAKKAPVIFEFEDEKGIFYSFNEQDNSEPINKAA